MTLAELQRLLTSVEPAAVLVPPRVMEHVVRHALQLSPMTWTVPHVSTWIAEKPALYRWIDHADLPVAQDVFLPTTVLLLAWPDEDHLRRTPADMAAAVSRFGSPGRRQALGGRHAHVRQAPRRHRRHRADRLRGDS